MLLQNWEMLPDYMKNDEVLEYYKILEKKKGSLLAKRILDIVASSVLIVLLIIPMLVIAITIKCGSKGKVIFKQKRITANGREFNIFKFRTMVENAESLGAQITGKDDARITKNGKILRKFRLDELPQIFNVFMGDMSMVGTRPEVPKYVNMYTNSMYATLLMPAGITSAASLMFKDEEVYFSDPELVDKNYMEVVLPEKMEENLNYIKKFSFFYDIKIMFKTIIQVFIK
ncbi:MAG: sugar transferase [Acutalibacteraceae bacterium]